MIKFYCFTPWTMGVFREVPRVMSRPGSDQALPEGERAGLALAASVAFSGTVAYLFLMGREHS
jgi:hypothetical protein